MSISLSYKTLCLVMVVAAVFTAGCSRSKTTSQASTGQSTTTAPVPAQQPVTPAAGPTQLPQQSTPQSQLPQNGASMGNAVPEPVSETPTAPEAPKPDDMEVKGTLDKETLVAEGTITNTGKVDAAAVIVIANVIGCVSVSDGKTTPTNINIIGYEPNIIVAQGYDTFKNLRAGESRPFRIKCSGNATDIIARLPKGKYRGSVGIWDTDVTTFNFDVKL